MSRAKNVTLLVVSTATLLALSAGVLIMNAGELVGTGPDSGTFVKKAIVREIEARTTEPISKDDLVNSPEKLVGVFSPNSPHSNSEYDAYVKVAGAAPNALGLFMKWDSPFRADSADRAYVRGAIPVVSWESWGKGSGGQDEAYNLDAILSGKFDDYLRQFARDVAAYDRLIMLRLNHEMNGSWYPWGINVNGNTGEKYIASWRHIHDIFTSEQVENVAWIWSVNVIRAIPDSEVPLLSLYPGDDYIDYVGVTGYSVGEVSAYELYQPTVDVVRTFTAKPIFLSEIGARPYNGKEGFIQSLFKYVNDRPDVSGFMWFQTTVETGGSDNWVLDDTPENAEAFRAGIAITPLAKLTRKIEDSSE